MGMFSRDPMKAAQADLVSLTARHEGVLRRLADAATKADEAAAEQRRLLIETDGADAVALKKAGDTCRKTADDRAALEDAARVLAEMIAEAQARLQTERDRIERSRIADERLAHVARIEAAVAKVDTASRALAEAHRAMAATVEAGVDPDPIGGPSAFVGQVTALVLHVALPRAYTPPLTYFDTATGQFTVTTPSEAAAPMLAALRQRAEDIRGGALAATMPVPALAPPVPVLVPEEVVFFLQPAGFRGNMNQWCEVEAGGWMVPAPVAARAFAMKVGFRPGTAQATAISRLLTEAPGHGLELNEDAGEVRRIPISRNGKDPQPARERVDLQISMHDWIAAERARLVGGSAVPA
ncbi:hypothetical protein [Methylobacterium sp. J-090]|uniref:hypothetical protein n=1 Tax=Methylobacterium sp. J-090 TaxID=2836666 RepID=UPI001FBAC682|nr:hypothetical protein [Methylobacterium sp. J-090]MCJ2082693.1 hypothetical protein [Methylobacterium sp. J-090]